MVCTSNCIILLNDTLEFVKIIKIQKKNFAVFCFLLFLNLESVQFCFHFKLARIKEKAKEGEKEEFLIKFLLFFASYFRLHEIIS